MPKTPKDSFIKSSAQYRAGTQILVDANSACAQWILLIRPLSGKTPDSLVDTGFRYLGYLQIINKIHAYSSASEKQTQKTNKTWGPFSHIHDSTLCG